MKNILLPLASIALITLAGCSGSMDKKDDMAAMPAGEAMMPFSGPDSVAYAKSLWASISEANMVGAGITRNAPYKGVHPHGAVLTTDTLIVAVEGHKGKAVVKKNFRGEGVTIDAVNADPAKYLESVTVMHKREKGYDSDNKDWFWAKYTPAGELVTNPKGMQLAGRVAKGKPKGCIACHQAAPGGDYIFTNSTATSSASGSTNPNY
jgi:hypothetical protein